MSVVIYVEDLTKRYGKETAVNGISFEVQRGEIFGLLGPNGAGKTTTLSIIEGLKKADSGSVQVMGIDMNRHPEAIKQHIGVQLQSTSLMPELMVIEQLQLFASLYRQNLSSAQISALLEQVGLEDKARQLPAKLSGGQQQRLALALVLINDPQIIFLDEPTAGLDTQSRRNLWDLIRSLRDKGRTIILTTHYIEEAEILCDRVGIMDKGLLLALDTPEALVNQHGQSSTIIVDVDLPIDLIRALPGVTNVVHKGHFAIESTAPSRTTSALLELTQKHYTEIAHYQVKQSSLEDVFLSLTGEIYEAEHEPIPA